MASDTSLRALERDARGSAALGAKPRPHWTLLHTGVVAALAILVIAPMPQAASLLPIAAVLAGLALLGGLAAQFREASRTGAATILLALSAGAAWAALPDILYGPAQDGARFVLLTVTIGVPVAALLGEPIRWLAPAFVLPSVAGGGWVVLATEPSGIALALLQVGVGVIVLMPRPGSIQVAGSVPSEAPRRPADDLLDFLLEGAATGAAADWFWGCDERLCLNGDLDRLAAITGRCGLTGRPLASLLTKGTPGAAEITHALAARAPFRDIVVEASGPDGAPAWWRLGARPIHDANGRFAGYHGLGSDVTALREAQARIAHLATHDGLTGLVNRETFQAHATRACAASAAGAAPLALLILDLDGFKQVNDDLGHALGDALLVAIAATLTQVAGPEAVVARLGGDEFAILHAPAKPSGAETLALAIIKAVSAPFTLDGQHQARVGVSIGIALAPEHTILPRDLARKADLALYRAKATGRGRHVVFVEAYEREREEKARLEADIGLALERDEFTMHYQPLLDLAEARIGGFEALIRWTSPTRGTVPPDAFIPAAEGNGLVVAIGRFALARACRDAATWPLPAFVAVNISPQHLRSPAFRDDVVAALKISGLPPSRLEIEITEGVFLDTSRASLDALTWLRERGIKVALDDFGTGFSSLGYLADFPVDKIKIDRSFVAGLLGSPQSRAVVDAILTLARTLGMRVVAEGVETAEQALALKLRRCDDLQGFLISRPQPADAIGRLLVDLPGALRSRVPALLESSLAAALVMKRSA